MSPPAIIDLTQDSPPTSPRTRKGKTVHANEPSTPLRPSFSTARPASANFKRVGISDIIVDLTQDDDSPVKLGGKRKVRAGDSLNDKTPKKKRKGQNAAGNKSVQPSPEKRLRTFRPRETQEYLKLKGRALTQKMFLIERTRHGTPEIPYESLLIAGTTGNIYTVTIDREPACDCPHAIKGNQCKHIIFAMIRVLKAPEELQYQLALLTSELRLIFENAPPIISPEAAKSAAAAEQNDGKRKPIEGDCPICFMPLEQSDGATTVYCKAACGNNFHAECFRLWTKTKQSSGEKVTCPLCRTEWEKEAPSGDLASIKHRALHGSTNDEGYVNVAEELGLSGERDSSTYHSSWNWSGSRRRIPRNRYDDYVDFDGY